MGPCLRRETYFEFFIHGFGASRRISSTGLP
jgi:hypothetical protein